MKWGIDTETNRDGSIFARLLIDGAPTGMICGNTAELAHLRTLLGLDPEAVAALEEERDSLACDLAEHRASVAELLDKVKVLEERAALAEEREERLIWAAAEVRRAIGDPTPCDDVVAARHLRALAQHNAEAARAALDALAVAARGAA